MTDVCTTTTTHTYFVFTLRRTRRYTHVGIYNIYIYYTTDTPCAFDFIHSNLRRVRDTWHIFWNRISNISHAVHWNHVHRLTVFHDYETRRPWNVDLFLFMKTKMFDRPAMSYLYSVALTRNNYYCFSTNVSGIYVNTVERASQYSIPARRQVFCFQDINILSFLRQKWL